MPVLQFLRKLALTEAVAAATAVAYLVGSYQITKVRDEAASHEILRHDLGLDVHRGATPQGKTAAGVKARVKTATVDLLRNKYTTSPGPNFKGRKKETILADAIREQPSGKAIILSNLEVLRVDARGLKTETFNVAHDHVGRYDFVNPVENATVGVEGPSEWQEVRAGTKITASPSSEHYPGQLVSIGNLIPDVARPIVIEAKDGAKVEIRNVKGAPATRESLQALVDSGALKVKAAVLFASGDIQIGIPPDTITPPSVPVTIPAVEKTAAAPALSFSDRGIVTVPLEKIRTTRGEIVTLKNFKIKLVDASKLKNGDIFEAVGLGVDRIDFVGTPPQGISVTVFGACTWGTASGFELNAYLDSDYQGPPVLIKNLKTDAPMHIMSLYQGVTQPLDTVAIEKINGVAATPNALNKLDEDGTLSGLGRYFRNLSVSRPVDTKSARATHATPAPIAAAPVAPTENAGRPGITILPNAVIRLADGKTKTVSKLSVCYVDASKLTNGQIINAEQLGVQRIDFYGTPRQGIAVHVVGACKLKYVDGMEIHASPGPLPGLEHHYPGAAVTIENLVLGGYPTAIVPEGRGWRGQAATINGVVVEYLNGVPCSPEQLNTALRSSGMLVIHANHIQVGLPSQVETGTVAPKEPVKEKAKEFLDKHPKVEGFLRRLVPN